MSTEHAPLLVGPTNITTADFEGRHTPRKGPRSEHGVLFRPISLAVQTQMRLTQ